MIVVLVAIENELKTSDLPNFQIEYTGVGKINAAIKTQEVISKHSPSLIINYGTAGSINKNLNGLVEVNHFIQRDMDATPLGFKIGETPFDEIEEITLGKPKYSCGSGDSFVAGTPKIMTDLVDMEAYAIAKACLIKKVDFKCFKYISDNANSSANKDWINNVAKGKALFIDYMTSHY